MKMKIAVVINVRGFLEVEVTDSKEDAKVVRMHVTPTGELDVSAYSVMSGGEGLTLTQREIASCLAEEEALKACATNYRPLDKFRETDIVPDPDKKEALN